MFRFISPLALAFEIIFQLCCVITRGPTCLENNILGLISDTKQRMPIDSVPYINGYLVELMLARRKDGGIFWNVAKYHRVAQQGVDQVPLAVRFLCLEFRKA